METKSKSDRQEYATEGVKGSGKKATAVEVCQKYDAWRDLRRPHEGQWMQNFAMLRGQQDVVFDDITQRLTPDQQPAHRNRISVNRMLAKLRTRIAKFLKNRPKPIVTPATTDRKDILNARVTQKVLDYLWRKLRLEDKFRDALMWSCVSGKGFWWFYWDANKLVPTPVTDPLTGQQVPVEAMLGDIVVEVGSPFEVLVADPSITRLADQPEIMRVKIRPVDEVKARYFDFKNRIKADTSYTEALHYEKRISALTSRGFTATLNDNYGSDKNAKKPATHVTVKELFVKPCGSYQKGRYVVVVGDVLVRDEELPYGMWDMENPYPVVDFTDIVGVGQYWGTTLLEQLIPIQKEYNTTRNKIIEQLKVMAFPKVKVPKQAQLADGAYDTEAGEILEYVALPGIAGPEFMIPPPISSDAWRSIDLMREEFDAITQLYPVSEGQVGGTQSGFQTSLLQEAADSVHAPDIRNHELSIEMALLKCRRLMAQYYDVPRLIRTTTTNDAPDIFQFSNKNIDENADIIVQAGSGLPTLAAARIQSALELWDRGILGNPQDPEVRRKVMGMLQLGGLEEVYETTRRDEEAARLENLNFEEGKPVEPPQFYQDHQIHYSLHADQLKMPETALWPEEARLQLLVHTIQTVFFFDPQGAYRLTQQYGLTGVIPEPAPEPTVDPTTGQPLPPGMDPNQPPPDDAPSIEDVLGGSGTPPTNHGDAIPPPPENAPSIDTLM